MFIVKTKTKQIMKGIYKDIIINLTINYEVKSKTEYVIFSIQSRKPNNYLDFSFRQDNMPLFVEEIFKKIKKHHSLRKDDVNNGFVIMGPCLKTGDIFKITFVHENDYENMLKRESVIMHDLDLSITLATNYLKPIYNDIIGHSVF